MFCTGCSTAKEAEKFYSNEHGRFLAYCSDCRAALKAHGGLLPELRAAEKPKSPLRFHRPVRTPAPKPADALATNFRVIQDPWIAHDLAWFFELNPSIGARNAGDR